MIFVGPGATLREAMQNRDISLESMAQKLEITPFELFNIIIGVYPMHKELATQLEEHLGISADFWLRLEANYRAEMELDDSQMLDK